MVDFFASLYEWAGLMLIYSTDMGDLLRGWDITCTNYIGQPLYIYIGLSMFAVTALVYILQYHIIDSSRLNKRHHWWIFSISNSFINFLISFTISYNIVITGNYCNQLNISLSDCVGFGFSNAIWSFIFLMIISSIPFIRQFSTNCRNTTFWKP